MTSSVHWHDIFFMRINPSLLGGEQDLTISSVNFVIISPQTKFEGVYRSELVGRSDSSFPDDNS